MRRSPAPPVVVRGLCATTLVVASLTAIVLLSFTSPASTSTILNADLPVLEEPAADHSAETNGYKAPDFTLMAEQQRETDRLWREASRGFMRMDKFSYRSRAGDLEIPAFLFQPLDEGPKWSRPALVWVHENIRGHLYEHFIPFIRQAVALGYVVIAPEYRGSIGYGADLYDAIDYGGVEVEDVVTAATVVVERSPSVDPGRIGIIGWSHGGLITMLATLRNPEVFSAAAAIVPVSNLIERLARKGVERQLAAIDPHHRFGGTPDERPELYKARSPLFQIDRLQIPLLVHAAANDEDVNIEELQPLIEALRTRKVALSDTKIYSHPPGGHLFDRRVDADTWAPENTAEQADSWRRVWRFFASKLASSRFAQS